MVNKKDEKPFCKKGSLVKIYAVFDNRVGNFF